MAYKDVFMKSYLTLMRSIQSTCSFNDFFLSTSCYFSSRQQRFRNYSLTNQIQYFPSAKIWTNVKNYKEYETEGNEQSDLVESVEDPNQPLVKLTVIDRKGKEKVIEARVGMTVMKAVTKHEDLEMEASCGGELACTTCHVYCKEKKDFFSPISEMEQDLLDEVSCYTDDSRLSCQMKILKEFDNVEIQISADGTNYFEEGSRKSR